MDYILRSPLVGLGSWIKSAFYIKTGRKPIDREMSRQAAEKNSKALRELMKREKERVKE